MVNPTTSWGVGGGQETVATCRMVRHWGGAGGVPGAGAEFTLTAQGPQLWQGGGGGGGPLGGSLTPAGQVHSGDFRSKEKARAETG